MSTALAQTKRYKELLSANNLTQNVKHFEGLYTEIAVSEDGYIAIYHPYIPEETVGYGFGQKKTFPGQQEWLQILHISQINDIDVDIDGTEITSVSGGLGGAIVGGLLGGAVGAVIGSAATSGKVSSDTTYEAVTLIFETKDFNNPRIEVPLYHSPKLYDTTVKAWANGLESFCIAAFPSGLRQYRNQKKSLGAHWYVLNKEGLRLWKEVYNSGEPNFTVIEELHSTLSQMLNAHQQREAPATSAPRISAADELAKFKALLDSGVITPHEFEAKKRQLLGL